MSAIRSKPCVTVNGFFDARILASDILLDIVLSPVKLPIAEAKEPMFPVVIAFVRSTIFAYFGSPAKLSNADPAPGTFPAATAEASFRYPCSSELSVMPAIKDASDIACPTGFMLDASTPNKEITSDPFTEPNFIAAIA